MGKEGPGQIPPQPVEGESANWLIIVQAAIRNPVHFIAEARLPSGLLNRFGQDTTCIRSNRMIVVGPLTLWC